MKIHPESILVMSFRLSKPLLRTTSILFLQEGPHRKHTENELWTGTAETGEPLHHDGGEDGHGDRGGHDLEHWGDAWPLLRDVHTQRCRGLLLAGEDCAEEAPKGREEETQGQRPQVLSSL